MFGANMQLLTILAQLAPAFQAVREHAAALDKQGMLPSKDVLAKMLKEKLRTFDPKVGNDSVLGPEERAELIAGFAGLIRRLVIAEKK